MLTVVSTDVSVQFESRCAKLCRSNCPFAVLRKLGRCLSLKRVLPDNPLKGNTFYDLKARPERYFVATAKLCTELGEENCKLSFCPTRSSCVPCHCKFDTESPAQLFLPNKRCLEKRKS